MENKIRRQVYENGLHGQKIICLPKNWCIENSVEKGSFVEIVPFNNPVRLILENAKRKKIKITLIGKNGEKRLGNIKGFYRNGVILDTGSWSELDWIGEIHYELAGKKSKIKVSEIK